MLRRVYVFAAIAICATATMILFRESQHLTICQIVNASRSIPIQRIGLCILLTSISFAALGTYDVLAGRIVAPGVVPAWLAWLAGATANSISNTLGFHAVMGPLIRFHFYRRVSLTVNQVAAIVGLSWATLALGFASVLALALLIKGFTIELLPGAALFAALAIIFAWLGPNGRSAKFAGLCLALPSRRTATTQAIIGGIEMLAAIGALYILMPPTELSFSAFAATYIGAVLLGIVSHSPGGLGVFEAVMLSISGNHDRAAVAASLLSYRLLYNLLPFSLSALALAGFAVFSRRFQFERG